MTRKKFRRTHFIAGSCDVDLFWNVRNILASISTGSFQTITKREHTRISSLSSYVGSIRPWIKVQGLSRGVQWRNANQQTISSSSSSSFSPAISSPGSVSWWSPVGSTSISSSSSTFSPTSFASGVTSSCSLLSSETSPLSTSSPLSAKQYHV